MSSTSSTIAFATAAALLSALALAACSAVTTSPTPEQTYVTVSDEQSVAKRLPWLVPADATNIRFVTRTVGKGAAVTFDSKEGITAVYCTIGEIGQAPDDLVVDWWPAETPTDGYDCSRWMAFEKDGSYFAWDTAR